MASKNSSRNMWIALLIVVLIGSLVWLIWNNRNKLKKCKRSTWCTTQQCCDNGIGDTCADASNPVPCMQNINCCSTQDMGTQAQNLGAFVPC